MVRLAGHSEGGWFSFHDIHCLWCRLSGRCLVVAGWNIIPSRSSRCVAVLRGGCGFGTLLGPEGTPECGCCSLAAPGLDRLTHPWCRRLLVGGVGGCGGGRGGLGCGCVLSVA